MGEDWHHTTIYFKHVERQSLFGLLLVLLLLIVFLVFIFIRFLYRQGSLPDLLMTMARTTTNQNHQRNTNGDLLPCPSLGLDVEKIKSLPIFTHKLSENPADGSSSSSSNNNPDDGSSSSIRTSSSNSCTFSFMESECSICLGTFEEEEILKLMPECLHVFHSECVDKWLSSSSTCPLCRSSI